MRFRSAIALIAALAAPAGADPTPFAHIEIPRSDPALGGLSGIDLRPDGSGFLAISDRGGHVFEGRIQRDGHRIVAVHVDGRRPLHLPPGIDDPDIEGIALSPMGDFYLSLEDPAEVWRVAPDGTVRVLPPLPDADTLPVNRRYEALAITADGALLTLPEQTPDATADFPLWRFDGQRWHEARRIPRRGPFLPVGADVGPDGALYLLERAFLIGFRNRIRRFELSDPGDPGTEVWSTDSHAAANFEGIAISEGPQGLRATLVSDDNFLPLLQQLLVEIPLASGTSLR